MGNYADWLALFAFLMVWSIHLRLKSLIPSQRTKTPPGHEELLSSVRTLNSENAELRHLLREMVLFSDRVGMYPIPERADLLRRSKKLLGMSSPNDN